MGLRLLPLYWASIVLEAFPFLLLGLLLSSILEQTIPGKFVKAIVFKNRILAVLAGMALGLFLPTCECGVVPVARRL